MREYAKISPHFWIGSTGRRLREAGPEAMLVALYLISNPHANMIGLYYLPLPCIAHETGLGTEGASEGLRRAIEAGFCCYDTASEMVFVNEMARFQIAERLDSKDNRCIGIQRECDALPNNPFLSKFYDKYAALFHLNNRRDSGSPSEGPSEGLRSQEQEQEQEQEKESISSNSDEFDGQLDDIFAYYLSQTERNPKTYELSWKRRQKGKARLRECLKKTGGDTSKAVALMKLAIDGLCASDWHMGRDAKTNGKRYCEWEEHLFGTYEAMERWWNADRVESFAQIKPSGHGPHAILVPAEVSALRREA